MFLGDKVSQQTSCFSASQISLLIFTIKYTYLKLELQRIILDLWCTNYAHVTQIPTTEEQGELIKHNPLPCFPYWEASI